MNSKFFQYIFILILSFSFTACGVKKPPLPENSQPAVYEKYLFNKTSQKKSAEEEENQKKN